VRLERLYPVLEQAKSGVAEQWVGRNHGCVVRGSGVRISAAAARTSAYRPI
jgi:hypothetical protein